MDGGGAQPTEVTVEVDVTDQGVGNRGRGCPDLGKDLRGGGLSHCPRPRLLLRQSAPLPSVEGLVGNKHVALGAPGVGSVTLLQDHYCVPHMTVRKVNREVGAV